MNGSDGFPGPAAQIIGKGLAGRNGNIGPMNRTPGQKSSQARLQPQAVLPARDEIGIIIAAAINGIARKQYLRHRRSMKREISGGKQDIGLAVADQSGKLEFLLPKAPRRRPGYFEEFNLREIVEFL